MGFGLLDIVIGVGIGYLGHRLSKRWSWTLVVACAAALVVNGLFDGLSYGNPFLHAQAIVFDALIWGICGLLAHAFFNWSRREKQGANRP